MWSNREQCLTSPPTQNRLSGKQFYRYQQYQSTEGKDTTKVNPEKTTQNTAIQKKYKKHKIP